MVKTGCKPVLNRRFYADHLNEKWLTHVTEFHYYVGPTMHKLYLSAILDLCDRGSAYTTQVFQTNWPWPALLRACLGRKMY